MLWTNNETSCIQYELYNIVYEIFKSERSNLNLAELKCRSKFTGYWAYKTITQIQIWDIIQGDLFDILKITILKKKGRLLLINRDLKDTDNLIFTMNNPWLNPRLGRGWEIAFSYGILINKCTRNEGNHL